MEADDDLEKVKVLESEDLELNADLFTHPRSLGHITARGWVLR